jgi:hypothetical protein
VDSTVDRELQRLGALLDRVERALALPAEDLSTPREELSAWSPAQQLFHLTLANELSLKNVSNLVAEKGALIRPLESLHPRAREVLRRGRFPAGAEAPRFVRAPERVDLELLRSIASDVRTAHGGLEGRGEAIAAAPNGIPHQALGVLSAAQWVRFARMHSAHHLELARRILRSS